MSEDSIQQNPVDLIVAAELFDGSIDLHELVALIEEQQRKIVDQKAEGRDTNHAEIRLAQMQRKLAGVMNTKPKFKARQPKQR